MSRAQVLIVDDEGEFAATLRKILVRRGFGVAVAADGHAALRAAETRRFDAVVLDVKMPGMDGLETLAEMKRIDPDVEIVMLTGHLSVADEREGLATGAFAYLLKPHPIPELVRALEAAAARTRGNRASRGAGS
jgi:DNA-binding response OmpR family regulator